MITAGARTTNCLSQSPAFVVALCHLGATAWQVVHPSCVVADASVFALRSAAKRCPYVVSSGLRLPVPLGSERRRWKSYLPAVADAVFFIPSQD